MSEPPDRAHLVLLEAGEAAASEWRGNKPRGWGMKKYLDNPTVNCLTFRQKRLARAAAKWYEICHP